MDARRAAWISTGLSVAACAATAWLLVAHEGARSTWRALGERVGHASYDADASDRAYRAVESALDAVRISADVAASWLVVSGLAIGAALRAPTPRATSDGRVLGASVVDAGIAACAVALALVESASPGVTAVIDRVGPAVVLGLVATAAGGQTVGQRILRGGAFAPGLAVGVRLLAVQPTLALVLVLAPALGLALALGRRPARRWLAPHLALARVDPIADR